MLICAAPAVVPVHVVTRPPLDQAAEEEIMAEVTKADKLIKQHTKESDDVTNRMRRLNAVDVSDYEQKTIKRLLNHEFLTVLLQHGFREGVAT